MNRTFMYGKPAMHRLAGYVSPERLTTFKLIFEAVCDELAIPNDAVDERKLVATTIMATGKTIESEMILVTTAMEAIADHRQKLFVTAKKSMNNNGFELQTGHEPSTDIHTEL